MKQLSILIIATVCTIQSWSQSAYIFPSPTAADEQITLFIDISQTTGGLKPMLEAHPEELDNVHVWTWAPADPLGGNGQWGDSNESLKMTHVTGLLFSITFVPVDFYNVDGPTFFSLGINCLAKLDNGNAYPDDGVGEAKTQDLHVDIVPKLCDNVYCIFPQLAKSEDFVSITYDNTQETNPAMQNLTDDVYLYFRVEQDIFTGVYYEQDQTLAVTIPALKMKPVPGQPGFFRLTFIPDDFFETIIPEGFDINTIKFFALTPGVTYPVFNLPYEDYSLLNCSN